MRDVPDYLNTTETSRDIWGSKDGIASQALGLGGFACLSLVKTNCLFRTLVNAGCPVGVQSRGQGHTDHSTLHTDHAPTHRR